MDKKELIREYIDSHREEYLKDLETLIEINSVRSEPADGAPFGVGARKTLDTAIEICNKYGFTTENIDGYVGTATFGGELNLDILGHLDVVNVSDEWTYEPFKVTNVDGMLYGRGVSDNKGPILAAIYGAKAVKELGLPMSKGVRIIMGTDEECGSGDLEYFFGVKKAKSAPNTFTPDADFPVYNVEKGRYAPVISKTWENETCEPRVTEVSGNFTVNVVPAKASAKIAGLSDEKLYELLKGHAAELNVELTVKDGTVTVKGTASHASLPENGNNSLTALLVLLTSLPLAQCESTRALDSLISLFPHGDFYGKALGVDMEDDLSGKTTLAFSVLKLNENGLTAMFDSRVSLAATEENTRAVITKALNDKGFDCEGPMSEGHYTPSDTPFVQGLLKSYEEFTGLKGECLSMGGGTYVHEIEGGVAFGAILPGFDPNMHGDDEHISLDDLLTAAKIFAYAISEICE